MCDAAGRLTIARRPRWGWLYAILPLAVAAFGAAEIVAISAPIIRPLPYGIAAIVVWGTIAWWTRANRAALEQFHWCTCASTSVTVRVITSESRQRPRRAIPEPLPIGDGVPAPASSSRRPLVIASR